MKLLIFNHWSLLFIILLLLINSSCSSTNLCKDYKTTEEKQICKNKRADSLERLNILMHRRY